MALRKKQQVSVSHDILKEKQDEVARLTRRADTAVNVVTRTIEDLVSVNSEIDTAMQEIDAYMENLEKTRNEMAERRKANSTVITNFSKLINTDNPA